MMQTPPANKVSNFDSQNPNETWNNKLKLNQKFAPFMTVKSTNQPYDPTTSTRIVCISDTHGKHREMVLPHGDILVHGGDFTLNGDKRTVSDFNQFLGHQLHLKKFKHIICIAGNHELTFHEEHYKEVQEYFHSEPMDCKSTKAALTNCIYLEDSLCTVNDMQFFGSPWTPLFHEWAFNLPRGNPCRAKWSEIPTSTEILITHGPPVGRGDEVLTFGKVGCVDLLHEIQERIKPKVHIFGHIHEGYGISSDGTTLFINACNVNKRYWVVNPCIVIDVPHDKSKPVVVVEADTNLSPTEVISWLQNCNEDTKSLVPYFSNLNTPIKAIDLLKNDIEQLCGQLKIRNKYDYRKLQKTMLLFHVNCFK